LPAVADVLLRADPDAVALQELTGAAQLNALLGLLHGRYKGAVARPGTGDRCEAVLVKDNAARFEQVAAAGRYALGADFRVRSDLPELLLVSAHTDAFSAARRRAYTEELVDWAHARSASARVFIAGDFNFELRAGNESNLYTDNLKHDSEAYSYLLRYFRDLGHDAGPTAINDRRIDYIFGPTEAVTVSRAEVLSRAAVGRMDHWPLLLEFELR
jgi:endonuclease/exonuclease/phosphatase family metal-dependent hydrolase